ncbi:PDZ domain-containing protein [Chryseotalea sanaruensis]|uniref:PDZ domain-containing protein n=1 Tax=Chryseotalea sanaruensis TaxID=2482724 RepID=A0A401U612_9BACT|nr:Do family serine endopeptidase [Chryseotalea sanaruensis]GCC50368.1 PDZ domain-containing protein [Chryseotalea sanaruensis]
MQQFKKLFSLPFMILLSITIGGCEAQINKEAEKDRSIDNHTISIEKKQSAGKGKIDTNQFEINAKLPTTDFRYAASKVTPAVVHVNCTWKANENQEELRQYDPFKDFFGDDWFRFFEPFRQRGPVEGSASGVILTADGYIITNNHVVQDADEVDIILHDQRSYKAKIIGSDPTTDLALLKIEETDLSFIEFGDSDNVEVGEWVLAVGNPFNLASTVTAGIISAKARNIGILKDREAVESFLQTDAAVNPGNSGGALVDLNGKLIGVNTAIATPTGTYAGYSFAIPVNIVKKVTNDLLNYGAVQRGYLGIIIRDMTGEIAKELDIRFTPGVYVDSLTKDGAASIAGIKAKDIIIKIDERKIETSPELQEIVAKHRPGEKLNVTFLRKGEERQAVVILQGAQQIASVSGKEYSKILDELGVEVQELTAKERTHYKLKGGIKITSITKGKIQSFTNIKKGFIIIKVNHTQIFTKDDFIRALENMKGQVIIEGVYPYSSGYFSYGFTM